METPDQLLQRLDNMGEGRVRQLMANRYFKPKALPLVNGWLTQKDEERERLKPRPDAEEALEKTRKLAREAHESVKKANEVAARADEKARKANRLAMTAIGVGSGALLVSVLALFALAIR